MLLMLRGCGGMVDTVVLETIDYTGSSPVIRKPMWRNGRRGGLKIRCL